MPAGFEHAARRADRPRGTPPRFRPRPALPDSRDAHRAPRPLGDTTNKRIGRASGHEAGKQENRKQEKDYEHNTDKERIALADECLSAE